MSSIPTPHIEVAGLGIIADTVVMPGDPLRAKLIAENFLTETILFNNVRGMLGYTGDYKGQKISVMGSGMGMSSIGIYSYELFAFYQVKRIIRVGSCGAYTESCNVHDLILVKEAYSDSNYVRIQSGGDDLRQILKPTEYLNAQIKHTASSLNIKLKEERIYTTDVFYRKNFDDYKIIRDQHQCAVVEMEAFALFANAEVLHKEAACILTVSDSLVTGRSTSSEERQRDFTAMINLALEAAVNPTI